MTKPARTGCGFRGKGGPRGRWASGFGRRNNNNRFTARFIRDDTIEDGSVVEGNSTFIKIWVMKNEGTVAWPEGTQLTFIGGDKMGAPDSVPVDVAGPGEESSIVLEMKAPN